ncbi:MAG: DUF1080 domain-containing protein [Chitinophagaceae bacterium]|nr:MAG: DUF1080 domain-containing protein [Chitinophagaceae bacterium]
MDVKPQPPAVKVDDPPKKVPDAPNFAKDEPISLLPNLLTDEEKKAGWKLLFDGATTDGWHTFGSATIDKRWVIKDNNLSFDPSIKLESPSKYGADIVSDKEYSNFELSLDWKISEGGNSGICIYVKEDFPKYTSMWQTGPEIQVLDDAKHPDGKIAKHNAGDLYDLIAHNNPKAIKGPNEWNHVMIKCVNGLLTVKVNGFTTVQTQLWNDTWKNMVAASKFAAYKDFGIYKKGRIGLQDHGDKVWYRNIKIKEL